MKSGRLALVSGLAILAPNFAGAQVTPDNPGAMVLIKTFADGRTTHAIVTERVALVVDSTFSSDPLVEASAW